MDTIAPFIVDIWLFHAENALTSTRLPAQTINGYDHLERKRSSLRADRKPNRPDNRRKRAAPKRHCRIPKRGTRPFPDGKRLKP
ncbi:hypothetical protein HMPREF0972_01781 [Actinomyces sp. oral taxon 848 str. F0332]|nr:hypothetical protein HMPREF0972_01781 [Actinomyces sp. oral taxon 848 str. F0332]